MQHILKRPALAGLSPEILALAAAPEPAPRPRPSVLTRLLTEAGTLAPVLDRIYPLNDLIAAHQYMETGHKRGSIVVV